MLAQKDNEMAEDDNSRFHSRTTFVISTKFKNYDYT